MIFFLLLSVYLQFGFGQDERFYRNMFNGILTDSKGPTPYKIKVFSPKYMIDLDRDGIEDSFQTIKKDGIDFFRINNAYGEKVFEAELATKGSKSSIFKVNFMSVNKNVDVLVLHYYEGYNDSSVFEASARLYFVTIENRKLEKANMSKGPYFWIEKERAAGKYFNRRYTVNLIDYDKDGQKEISVSFNKGTKVFYYKSGGIWDSI